MERHSITYAYATQPDLSRHAQRTRSLLVAGAAAGPLFVGLVLAQAVTRGGFDPTHHPISLLSLGEHGWVQVTNFVVTGLLMCAFAAGVRRVLVTGTGRVWAPVLLALHGAGLVMGGVFLPDPGLGFPPGTPDAVPDELSLHGILHAAAPMLAFTALVACCCVLGRRFRSDGEMAWAAYSVATAAVTLILCAWPGQEDAGPRLAVAVTLGFCWTTLLALDLRRQV